MSALRSAEAGVQWAEEWVPLKAIIRHAPWQVRSRLDAGAVKRYAEMTRAGSAPPPIRVGRVGGKLYLLDGWHRMEAGALQTCRGGLEGETVLALVATMDEREARWQAAQANLGHGVPLKTRDLHEVFKAYIKARKHVNPDGSLRSYREIAAVIGKPHTTIRTWMLRYFPRVAAEMGGAEYGNPRAEPPPPDPEDLAEEHRMAALEAIDEVTLRLDRLSSKGRWEVVRRLEAAREAALALGVEEPHAQDF